MWSAPLPGLEVRCNLREVRDIVQYLLFFLCAFIIALEALSIGRVEGHENIMYVVILLLLNIAH